MLYIFKHLLDKVTIAILPPISIADEEDNTHVKLFIVYNIVAKITEQYG